MKKSILLMCVFGVIACSDSGPVVNEEIPLTNNNDNTVCVVNGVSNSCSMNAWTYYSPYHEAVVSCSNTGECKTGTSCMLWDGSSGVCQPKP